MIRGIINKNDTYRPLYSKNALVTNKKAILINKIDYRIYNQKCLIKKLPIIVTDMGISTANAQNCFNYYNNPLTGHEGAYAKVIIYYQDKFFGETDFCKITVSSYDGGDIRTVSGFNNLKTNFHCIKGNYQVVLSTSYFMSSLEEDVSTDIELGTNSNLFKKDYFNSKDYTYEIYQLEK